MLFPHVQLPAYVRADLRVLQARYDVVLISCRPAHRVVGALRACLSADLLFCWFGSIRFLPVAVLARCLGKPVVIVTGGYDVACVPEIGYGNMRAGVSRLLGRWLFRTATVVLSNSRSCAREARDNAGVKPTKQRLVYLGVDPQRFLLRTPVAKERFVLTVAGIDACTIHRKGLLAVAEVSKLMPDVPFVIAGGAEPDARLRLGAVGGPNLRLLGFVSDSELTDLYARAKVYFQPSLHEAFGCSVAEAMFFNCVPVVTRRYALPEVVGDCGYYAPAGDASAMAAAVRRALTEGLPSGAQEPRTRIMREFPSSLRASLLEETIEQLRR